MLVWMPVRASFVINGGTYRADTLVHRQVGPGMINTIVRLPQYPLNIYVVAVDLNNPNNRVESTFGYGTLGRTELLSHAVTRNTTPTKRPLVACNANFWVVTGNGAPFTSFEMGFPLGGVVRNDTTIVNDNNTTDQWAGGPYLSGVASITTNKDLVFGHLMWEGTITADKLAQPLVYHNVNRRAVAGEICLFGPAYTRTRAFEDDWVEFNTRGNNHTDNYYLDFVEGSDWAVNGPMTLKVAKIVTDADRQKLGTYDACLAVTGDANKAAMAALAVGDVIQLTSGWRTLDEGAAEQYPRIENLVTGNTVIMHNGILTEGNFNMQYTSDPYSRTIYASSADGRHLYLLVADKSTSPIYGLSRGCPSADALQILQQMYPDVSEAVNMDAGGSAEMLVRGKVINTTTENNPRGVATGWMVEAIGEEDHEVASIAFDLFRLDVPSYSSVTPRVLGYNRIGELVNEDVQGFTLSCEETIGQASGDTFVAIGQEARGTLTAELNGMTATVPVHVINAQPALVLNSILIDNRPYPIEVSATVVSNTYFYNPALLDWSIDDSDVATITDGVLQGKSNGTTNMSFAVGPYSGSGQVTVEISPEEYLYQGWEGWTTKGAGAKEIVLDETTGNITFTYSSNRAPYLQLSKDLTLYGLPDTVGVTFNTSIPVDYVQIDTRNRFNTTSNYLKFYPEDGASTFETGVDHTILLDLDVLGGAGYVGTYPITIKSIKFSINKNSEAGDHVMNMKSFYCHYPDIPEPQVLKGDVNGDGEVNITDVNDIIDCILMGSSAINADVNNDGEVNITDVSDIIDIILNK